MFWVYLRSIFNIYFIVILRGSEMLCKECNRYKAEIHQTFTDLALSISNLQRAVIAPYVPVKQGITLFRPRFPSVKLASVILPMQWDYSRRPKVSAPAPIAIEDCLRAFIREEPVYGVECEHCTIHSISSRSDTPSGSESGSGDFQSGEGVTPAIVKSDFVKRMSISRLPDIFCVHLSRQIAGGYSQGSMGAWKQRTRVTFGQELNLGPFFQAWGRSSSSCTPFSGSYAGIQCPPPRSSDLYDLRAVIVHMGVDNTGEGPTFTYPSSFLVRRLCTCLHG